MVAERYSLDTASLIFPAIARRDSCDISRTSMTLDEPIDARLLQQALDDLRDRFPTFCVALRHDFFEYYLKTCAEPLRVRPEGTVPLAPMSRREAETACMRILYGPDHIAVEAYHVLSDGRGMLVFLCNLVARYLELKYGTPIPHEGLILDWRETPSAEELEDAFLRYAADRAAVPNDPSVYLLHGHTEPRGTALITLGRANTQELLDAAHRHKVSVTSLLVAVMVQAILEIQRADSPRKRSKPVRLRVPVDLRGLFESSTLRNFSLVVNVGVKPRKEPYSFEELCATIQQQMRASATPENMAATMAAAVRLRTSPLFWLTPLFVKNALARLVYELKGERCGCMTVSNFNVVRLPKPMGTHVRRVETVSGPARLAPHVCGLVSYGGTTYISVTRVLRETDFEDRVFAHLRELGITVDVQDLARKPRDRGFGRGCPF